MTEMVSKETVRNDAEKYLNEAVSKLLGDNFLRLKRLDGEKNQTLHI